MGLFNVTVHMLSHWAYLHNRETVTMVLYNACVWLLGRFTKQIYGHWVGLHNKDDCYGQSMSLQHPSLVQMRACPLLVSVAGIADAWSHGRSCRQLP